MGRTWRKGQGTGVGQRPWGAQSTYYPSVSTGLLQYTNNQHGLAPAKCHSRMSASRSYEEDLILILEVPQNHLGSLLKTEMPVPSSIC